MIHIQHKIIYCVHNSKIVYFTITGSLWTWFFTLILRVMTPRNLVCTEILKEHNAYIFRLHNGSNRFLWKVRIIYRTIRCHNQKYQDMNFHRCDNLKSKGINLSGTTHRPCSASISYISRTKWAFVIRKMKKQYRCLSTQNCVNLWCDKFRNSKFYHPATRKHKKTVNKTRSNTAQPAWIACSMRFDNARTSCAEHCLYVRQQDNRPTYTLLSSSFEGLGPLACYYFLINTNHIYIYLVGLLERVISL
jgi:hypothetical protein